MTVLTKLALLVSFGLGLLLVEAKPVDVLLSSGTHVTGRSQSGLDTFNGIPYALPPTGALRLRPPQRLPSGYLDNVDATGRAAACPQLLLSAADKDIIGQVGSKLLELPFLNQLTGQEDCLTISVQRPSNTAPDAKLPVFFWIFGGGYTAGSTSTYDGSSFLNEGIKNKQPFIFVAVNYRLNAFGFLSGAQVHKDGSANLGLLDQRLGLEWVADNIANFGGDPDRVVLWGESAGAFSVFYQMALHGGNATYKGRPLFRGGILNSGTGVPAEPVDGPKGQAVYDKVVREAGCADASETLACLRSLDYETLHNAITDSFAGSLSYYGTKMSFLPRPDGNVLLASPEDAAKTGQYFAVPIIVGNQEDEGTLFSLFQRNITSDAELVDYFHTNLITDASKEQLSDWVSSYRNGHVGSPFRTSSTGGPYPMFKEIAAMLGDWSFILARRQFLQDISSAHPDVPAWSYLSSYAHGLPVLGTSHASDLVQTFYGLSPTYATKSTRKYYLNFLYSLDPNSKTDGYKQWPRWQENKTLLWFETQFATSYLKDDFRSEQHDALRELGNAGRQ
ncbi:hypothetical protein G3M48_004427 [Beauveria asiatica]|uniref:Carboxylic ester hydrolase n=1 Tax=Beauveria asiatica TaxID=1069075 RepID=A0AAW0S6S6_9HYPO